MVENEKYLCKRCKSPVFFTGYKDNNKVYHCKKCYQLLSKKYLIKKK